jgi:hypothetical protein
VGSQQVATLIDALKYVVPKQFIHKWYIALCFRWTNVYCIYILSLNDFLINLWNCSSSCQYQRRTSLTS